MDTNSCVTAQKKATESFGQLNGLFRSHSGIGVPLIFITVGVLLATSRNYLAAIVALGGLALFVVLGNLRARRSPKK